MGGNGGGGSRPGASARSPPGVPAAYLSSNATGSVGSVPGSESMAPPAAAAAPLCAALAASLEFKRPQPLPPSLRRQGVKPLKAPRRRAKGGHGRN